MTQDDPQPDTQVGPRIAQESHNHRAGPGPFRRLRLWLSGHPREPEPPSLLQMRAEWAEYQVAFNDLLTKFSALLARQAKAEKKRQERATDTHETFRPPPNDKAALRSALAHRMYGDRIDRILTAKNGSGQDEPRE